MATLYGRIMQSVREQIGDDMLEHPDVLDLILDLADRTRNEPNTMELPETREEIDRVTSQISRRNRLQAWFGLKTR